MAKKAKGTKKAKPRIKKRVSSYARLVGKYMKAGKDMKAAHAAAKAEQGSSKKRSAKKSATRKPAKRKLRVIPASRPRKPARKPRKPSVRKPAARKSAAKSGSAPKERKLSKAALHAVRVKAGKKVAALMRKRRAAAKSAPKSRKPATRKPAARKPRKSAARKPATRKPATRKHLVRWAAGVHHPYTGVNVGGRIMSLQDKGLFKVSGEPRKGAGPVQARKVYGALVPSGAKTRALRSGRGGTRLGQMIRANPYRDKSLLRNAEPISARVMDVLPTKDVAIEMAKQTGLIGIGFAGGISLGRLFAANPMVQTTLVPITGVWTGVVGNLLTAAGFYAAGRLNDKVAPFAPWLVGGAALSAIVNAGTALVARGTISPAFAQWIAPWAAAAPAAVASANGAEPAAAAAETNLGQIDVYEQAMSGVEDQLEFELRRAGMSGMGEGIFAKDGIFGDYSEVAPYTSSVQEGIAAYEQVPVGAEVEEAFAEYEPMPLSAYETTPLRGTVEQATAGMGADSALLQQIAVATRRITQRRIAEGKPVNEAFIQSMKTAAARAASRRTAGSGPSMGAIPGAPQRWGLTRENPGLYRQTWSRPVGTSAQGSAAEIDALEGEGIFGKGRGEGIFG